MKIPLFPKTWMDGDITDTHSAQVPVTTHALHYGTTAFEGMRAYWNGKNLNVFRVKEHIRRLHRSGLFYNIVAPYSEKEISDAIIDLCIANSIRENAYIRPMYFVGEWGIDLYLNQDAPVRFVILTFPLKRYFAQSAISACVVPTRRFSDQSIPVKAKMGGNYLNSIAATLEAKQGGFDEAIMLDMSGCVSEGPGENIFLVQDGQLVTPDAASSILDGITKDTIIWLADRLGIKTVHRRVAYSELHTADEIFMTGTAVEVCAIKRVGNHDISGSPGEITTKLSNMYTDAVHGRGDVPEEWLMQVY